MPSASSWRRCRASKRDGKRDEGTMLISRSDRGRFATWWYTIDRVLLTAVLLLMAAGVIMLAASPPVAERLGLDSFHFARRQLAYLVPAAMILIATSFLDERQARRASLWCLIAGIGLMTAAIMVGPEIKGAHRWIDLGPVSIQPSEIRQAGARRHDRVAALGTRAPARHAGSAARLRAIRHCRGSAGDAARCRADRGGRRGVRRDAVRIRHTVADGRRARRALGGGGCRRLPDAAARVLAHRPILQSRTRRYIPDRHCLAGIPQRRAIRHRSRRRGGQADAS